MFVGEHQDTQVRTYNLKNELIESGVSLDEARITPMGRASKSTIMVVHSERIRFP